MEYNSKYTGTDIESMLDSVNAKSIYSGGTGITITNGVISADSYTKAESDAKYATKEGYYDKEYMDSKFKVISAGLNDLNEKVPTKISQLTNDSGYLTEHQDISGLATKEEISGLATKQEISGLATKQEISGLATKAESDAKYATKQEISELATKAESDAKYATKAESDAKYATKEDVPYKFVKLTQSAYDSLDPKDANTIYIIGE